MSELGSGLPAFSANAIDGSTVAISLLSALLPAMSAAMVSSFVSIKYHRFTKAKSFNVNSTKCLVDITDKEKVMYRRYTSDIP